MRKTFVKFAESLDMSDIPKIIFSEILDNTTDEFWNDLPQEIQNENTKSVLIITETLQENSLEQSQLQKVIAACQLEKEEYYILHLTQNQQIAWHKLKTQFHPQTVILFGISPQKLGISSYFRLNSVNNFDDCQWIPALSIAQMEEQLEAKKQLWTNALKPHFVDAKTA